VTRSSALVCAAFASALVGLPVTLVTYVIDHRDLALLALATGSAVAVVITIPARSHRGFAAWLLIGSMLNAAIQFTAWHHALGTDQPGVAAKVAELPDSLRRLLHDSHAESDARRAWLYGLVALVQALPVIGCRAIKDRAGSAPPAL
jgi:hypothetical protein